MIKHIVVTCLLIASSCGIASPSVLFKGSDTTISSLKNIHLNQVQLTNLNSTDTLLISSTDPVCLFKQDRILSSINESGLVVPASLGVKPTDTVTLWSEDWFLLDSIEAAPTVWISKVGLKDYYITILFAVLLCFIAYLKFHQPHSFGFYFNPMALLNNRLYDASFNFQPFLFPNLIFLVLNGAIIGAVVGDVCYPGQVLTKLQFSAVGALLLPLKASGSYMVLSYLTAYSVNRVLHFSFVRMVNFFSVCLLIIRVEQVGLLSFGAVGLVVLTMVFLAFWLLRASIDILSQGIFQKFYFFSYLCALEMLPVVFVCLVVSRI